MELYEALDLGQSTIISLVGGGGKTSIMFRLAEEIPGQQRVLITTTTKIRVPADSKYPCFCIEEEGYSKEALIKVLKAGERPVLASERLQEDNKLNGVREDYLSILLREGQVDCILVEADGSKGRPLKGHLGYEPVIPQLTTHLVIVIGADVIGKRLDSEYVHRPEIVTRLTGQKVGTVIKPETIAQLITHPQGIMRTSPHGAKNIVIINKIDCLKSLDEAYKTARLLKRDSSISKVLLCSIRNEDPVADIIE